MIHHMLCLQVVDEYSSNSFRLLAMAVGVIKHASELNLAQMTSQQVEARATNMRLLCLVVLTNNVRPDSKDTIAHLQEGYVIAARVCPYKSQLRSCVVHICSTHDAIVCLD